MSRSHRRVEVGSRREPGRDLDHISAIIDQGWRRVSVTTGYLSEREARFVMAAAALAPAQGKNLEIGSFKGRSTVGIAYVTRELGLGTVVAVDPHTSPSTTDPDLKGKTIAWGARGSGLVVLARYVLDGLGLDMTRDFQSIYLDQAGDGPAMVMDGRAAALWGGGSGWPGFTAVARGPAGARFLVPDLDGIQRIQRKHPFLKLMLVPANSYPGQTAELHSVGSWSFIMARPTLADGVAYRLARALHRGEAALGARLAQARETTAANTVAAVARPELLHPGVRRYLAEAGLGPR